MKDFIKKIVIFSLYPATFFLFNIIINSSIYKISNGLKESNNVLIVGDSHTQKGINPEFFANADNISQYDEPYILSFWKIKEIFKRNKPDTLILGFSPHNISKYNDHKFSHKKWANEMFRRAYTIEKFSEIDTHIKVDYLTFFKTKFKQISFFPKKDHSTFIGSYTNLKKSNIGNWQSSINRHFYDFNQNGDLSVLSVKYLDSIINICRDNKVLPILVGCPVHKSYYDKIPSKMKTEYNYLKQKYSDVLIIDRMENSYSDTLFLDSDHLNDYGSKRFTKELIGLIRM